jgi:aminoglycoside phosphotransferase (APT) family kinase protein
MRVLATGTLLAEVRTARGGSFLLRVEPRPPGAAGALERLLACAPPVEVTSRLVLPLASGTLGERFWTLEERRPGAHPRRMTPALWRECTSFLEALHAVAPPSDAAVRPLADDLAQVEWLLPADVVPAVRAAVEQAAQRLEGMWRGWSHGDFHPRNLLVGDGLQAVLDWDAAAPCALPLVDALHLLATTAPRARRSPHGARCTRYLWPLARAGGDERLRAHCRATGVDPRPDVLEAIAVAYWLTRVARDVAVFADRSSRPDWLRLNVVEPARALAAGS